jgi:hypothetical protein
MNDRQDLKWDGLKLRLKSGRLLATVEPDAKWPKMYRVRLPDGHVTDMVNLSRAKDAAMELTINRLNKRRHAALDRGYVRQNLEAAE